MNRRKQAPGGGIDGPDPVEEARALLQSLGRGDFFEGWVTERPARSPVVRGDPSWAPPFNRLLRTALTGFQAGDFATAADLWTELLPALLDKDSFGGCEDPRSLLEADLPIHLAAWCRSIYALRRPLHRCHAVAEALHSVARLQIPLHIKAIAAAHPLAPEGWEAFRGGLRAALLQIPVDSAEWGALRSHLIGRLPRSEGEIQDLRLIAARAGGAIPELHHELIAGLAASDRWEEATLAAAAAEREAESPFIRAIFADRLAALYWEKDDLREAEARARAWLAAPRTDRLLRLAAATSSLEPILARAYEELDDQGLIVEVEILAGDVEVATARLQGADPAFGHDPEHPLCPVLAALLILSLGGMPPPDGGAIERAARLGFPTPPRPPWPDREAEPASVIALVASRHPAWRQDAPWYRAQAHHELIRFADGTVGSGAHYARIALFAAAWAEAAAWAGEGDEARSFPIRLYRRFPRRRSFRKEIETAMTRVVWPP